MAAKPLQGVHEGVGEGVGGETEQEGGDNREIGEEDNV